MATHTEIERAALEILLIRRILGFPRLAEKERKESLSIKQVRLLKSKDRGMWEDWEQAAICQEHLPNSLECNRSLIHFANVRYLGCFSFLCFITRNHSTDLPGLALPAEA